MKTGIAAAATRPLDVLIFAAKGGYEDLVKVAQPKAINRYPMQVMNIADELGVEGLLEEAVDAAIIDRGFQFQVLEYAVRHELPDIADEAAQTTMRKRISMRVTEAAKILPHRALVAWVCILILLVHQFEHLPNKRTDKLCRCLV